MAIFYSASALQLTLFVGEQAIKAAREGGSRR